MLKRKKFIIAIVVLVMLLATSVTAYAAVNVCTLLPANKGEVNTAALSATTSHYSGYNSTTSTNSMNLKFQVKVGSSWETLVTDNYKIGAYKASTPIGVSSPQSWRTKIYSAGGTGGVEGTGCVFDY